jgi:hypothetical protein
MAKKATVETAPLTLALEKAHEPAQALTLNQKMGAWLVAKAILNDSHYREAAEILKYAKGMINEVEEERKKLTKPLDEVKAHLMANAKVIAGPAKDLEAHIKQLMLGYENDKRQAAMAEAEKQARKVQSQSPQAADEIRQSAALAVVTPEVSGLSIRTTRKARVTDLMKLVKAIVAGKAPLDCIEANEKYLNAMAKVSSGDSTIPGTEFYTESGVASTSYSRS